MENDTLDAKDNSPRDQKNNYGWKLPPNFKPPNPKLVYLFVVLLIVTFLIVVILNNGFWGYAGSPH